MQRLGCGWGGVAVHRLGGGSGRLAAHAGYRVPVGWRCVQRWLGVAVQRRLGWRRRSQNSWGVSRGVAPGLLAGRSRPWVVRWRQTVTVESKRKPYLATASAKMADNGVEMLSSHSEYKTLTENIKLSLSSH